MGRTDLGDVMGGCREVRVVDSSELADVRRNFSDPLVGGMNPPQEALQQQGRVVAWQPNGGVYETTGNYGGNRGGQATLTTLSWMIDGLRGLVVTQTKL